MSPGRAGSSRDPIGTALPGGKGGGVGEARGRSLPIVQGKRCGRGTAPSGGEGREICNSLHGGRALYSNFSFRHTFVKKRQFLWG